MSWTGATDNRTRIAPEPEVAPEAAIAAQFRRLDVRLKQAFGTLEPFMSADRASQPFRGLYLAPADALGYLDLEPGASRLVEPGVGAADPVSLLGNPEPSTRFGRFGRVFNLSPFDLAVVLIALAPDYDLKYERVYAFLQDDISRRRPSVDLALNLLCTSSHDKLSRRLHFAPGAPLVQSRLLRLVGEQHSTAPLLSWSIRLDEQIIRFLLAQRGLDPRLAPFTKLLWPQPPSRPPASSLSERTLRSLITKVGRARKERRPARYYFQGPRGSGQSAVAMAIAGELDAALLWVDVSRLPTAPASEIDDLIRVLLREAQFQGAILYLEPWDALFDSQPPGTALVRETLLDDLSGFTGTMILAGERNWEPEPRGPRGVVPVVFEIPSFDVRRACWEAQAAESQIRLTTGQLDTLASLYRLTQDQIANAAATLAATAPAPDRYEESDEVPAHLLYAAARAESGHALARLASRVDAVHRWDDLILDDDTKLQLREICEQIRFKHRVRGEWGFGQKVARSAGTNALFCGPSGTGKTTAASIIASEMHLDLFEIDLSRVVSKYIGETEANLKKIFDAAVNSNAILLFNEADALWGKRSDVHDAHDRYANIEIAFLLQEMEKFDGVAILTTNLRQHMDESFTRRINAIVEFAFPDVATRRRIWEVLLPAAAPRGPIDLDLLARIRLSGGNIKNCVYAAAFYAVAEDRPIETAHLVQAVRREHQKLGRNVNESELGPYARLPNK